MNFTRKIFALDPQTRLEICEHEHAPYRGIMPNTGVRRCRMCGRFFDNEEQLFRARKEAKQAKRKEQSHGRS